MARKQNQRTARRSGAQNTKARQSVPSATGQIRIIGGDWRGRKLPVLNADGLRPTSDRVRETLFNWLQFDVPGARCLDVFAGSGALGFEALSRGAKQVTLLELNAANANQLNQNLVTLQALHAQVVQTDSLQWLVNNAENPPADSYDVIFVDPPFNQGLMQPTVDLLFKSGLLKSGQACLYLEQEKQLDWPNLPKEWLCVKEKTTSQVKFGLFRLQNA